MEDGCQPKLVSIRLLYECGKVCSSSQCIQYMQRCQEFHALCHFMCDLYICVAKSWLLCLSARHLLLSTCRHLTTTEIVEREHKLFKRSHNYFVVIIV